MEDCSGFLKEVGFCSGPVGDEEAKDTAGSFLYESMKVSSQSEDDSSSESASTSSTRPFGTGRPGSRLDAPGWPIGIVPGNPGEDGGDAADANDRMEQKKTTDVKKGSLRALFTEFPPFWASSSPVATTGTSSSCITTLFLYRSNFARSRLVFSSTSVNMFSSSATRDIGGSSYISPRFVK